MNLFNFLNAKINPICHLLAFLGAHHILYVSRIRVKMVTSLRVKRPQDPKRISWKMKGLIRDLNSVLREEEQQLLQPKFYVFTWPIRTLTQQGFQQNIAVVTQQVFVSGVARFHSSGVAGFFLTVAWQPFFGGGHPGRVVTTASRGRKFEFKKTRIMYLNVVYFTGLNNLKYIQRSRLYLKISLCRSLDFAPFPPPAHNPSQATPACMN